ncbi:MAG: hypothetical protein IKO46_01495 [Salinivirgaceae bacterium]|nr:hypothetical protein [Salinivirgaceae bacterium]
MVFEIVEIFIGVIFFVWGIIILLGKIDKWLFYSGKQINMKRFRIVRGAESLLGGVWFVTNHLLGNLSTVLLAILIIVPLFLQFTWCRKLPEN